jgi:GntR family transcriptional repressor for pyruvate dehydrogenase complex
MSRGQPRTAPDDARDAASPAAGGLQRAPGLAEALARHLRAAIVEGSFGPGEKLPTEAALAESFGVSRPVVREAIAQLRFQGLVVSQQGRGVFVSETGAGTLFSLDAADLSDPQTLAQIYQLRMILEIGAARLAARHATRGRKAALRRALAALDQTVTRGGDGIAADIAFHLAIAEASGNDQLAALMRMLYGSLRKSISVARRNSEREGPETVLRVQEQHHALCAAILDGDEDGAEAAMRRHLVFTAGQLRLKL